MKKRRNKARNNLSVKTLPQKRLEWAIARSLQTQRLMKELSQALKEKRGTT